MCESFARTNGFGLLTSSSQRVVIALFWWLVLGVMLSFALTILLRQSERLGQGNSTAEHARRPLIPCGATLILLCWLPWLIANFPASIAGDVHWQLQQFYGYTPWTTHHPPLATLIMGSLLELGRMMGDANIGLFAYVLLQCVVAAGVASYSLYEARRLGASQLFWLAGVAFFGLTPFWGAFAQWYEKSLLYTSLISLMTIVCSRIILKRDATRGEVIALLLAGLASALLRNNGIYAALPCCVVCIALAKGKSRRTLALGSAGVLAVYLLANSVLYPALGVQKGSIGEALSIPFQQTARTVRDHGDELTSEDKAAINAVLDYDALAYVYDPVLSDPVKSTYHGATESFGPYLTTWASMGMRFPVSYLAAALSLSYGYLAPVEPSLSATIELHPYGNDALTVDGSLYDMLGLGRRYTDGPAALSARIASLSVRIPVLRCLAMPGLYTWLVIVALYLLARRHLWREALAFIPAIVNILVCIASPMANSLRYALPVVMLAPFYLAWTWACLHQSEG